MDKLFPVFFTLKKNNILIDLTIENFFNNAFTEKMYSL